MKEEQRMTAIKNLKPAKIFPPGYFVREAMKDSEKSEMELAASLGLTIRELRRLFKDEHRIDENLAKKLSGVFKTSKQFWLNLETNYRKRIESSPLIKNGGARFGGGIYTIPDLVSILKKPISKIRYWVEQYWDKELGQAYESRYSWNIEFTKAIDFYTMVELVIFAEFRDQKLPSEEIIKTHKNLSGRYNTAYPFANKEILLGLRTDGYKLYMHELDSTETADGSGQLNLAFIQAFFKELEFDADNLATRFWPMGKSNCVVVDPKRQFGHPVVANTNIFPETIYNMHLAKEPIPFIAFTYDLTEKQVRDAIQYCTKAA